MAKHISKDLLDLFWILAEGSETERSKATNSLVNLLVDLQGDDKVPCKEVKYTISRLLKGLSSSRKWARLGYSTALTQVLRHVKVIKTGGFLESVKQFLKPQPGDSKSYSSACLLGKVLAYTALIRSAKIKLAKEQYILKTVEEILSLSSQKRPLQLICTNALVQLIEAVDSKSFKEIIFPKLEKQLSRGWQDCTPDDLLLVLTCVQYHKDVLDKKFLKQHWLHKAIVSEETLSQVTNVLSKSATSFPVLHPIQKGVIDYAAKKHLLSQFWLNSIDGNLMKATPARQQICLSLVPNGLKLASDINEVEVILSRSIVNSLVTGLHSNKHDLHAVASLTIAEICKYSESAPSDVQMAIIRCLLKHHGNLEFDSFSKTQTIGRLTQSLNLESTKQWLQIVKDMVLENSFFGEKSPNDLESVCHWAVTNLNNLIISGTMAEDQSLQADVVQFYFLHGYFNLIKTSNDIPQCSKLPTVALGSNRKVFQDGITAALNKLSTYRSGKSDKIALSLKYISFLYDQLKYVQTLLNCNNVKLVKDISDQALEQWNKLMVTIEKIKDKLSSDKVDEGHAFLLLFMHLGLQLFTEPKQAIDSLEDLHFCYKRVTAKLRRSSRGKTTEPEWIEVVTELILSLLSQAKHLLRIVVKNVFKILTPHINENAMALILNVIKPKGEGDAGDDEDYEDDPIDFEDEEENEEEDMSEEDNEKDGKQPENGKDESESEDSEDSDDEEASDEESEDAPDDAEVSEELKIALKTVLGKAAVDSDIEDLEDSDSDMDDEAMMKMDSQLAAAFKSMSKNKKQDKLKIQLLRHFELRCMDLVAVVTENQPSASLVVPILHTLIDIINQRESSYNALSERANGILARLAKVKKFNIDIDFNPKMLLEAADELIEFSKTVSAAHVIFRIGMALEIIVSLATSFPKAKVVEDLCSVILKHLSNFCMERDSKLSHLLFFKLLERKSVELWSLSSKLLSHTLDEDVRMFCRTQTCSMLACMINKQNIEKIEENRWNPIRDQILKDIPQVLSDRKVHKDIKKRNVHEMLLLLNKTIKTMEKEKALANLPEELDETLVILKKLVNKESRTICNQLLALMNTKEQTKKKAEKRKTPSHEFQENSDKNDEPSTKKKKKDSKRKKKKNKTNNTTEAEAIKAAKKQKK